MFLSHNAYLTLSWSHDMCDGVNGANFWSADKSGIKP